MTTTTTTHASEGGDRLYDPEEICTLTTAALGERVAWIQSEIVPHVLESEALDDGVAWEMADRPGLADRVDELIEAESKCCSELSFVRMEGASAERVRLEVHGVDPHAAIFAREGQGAPGAPFAGRLGRAIATGTIGALLVCCVLPLTLGAIGGAALAAPLATLDAPIPIAIAAFAGAGVVWWWQGRTTPAAR